VTARIEYCDVCEAVRTFHAHPAGWRCGECNHCRESFQQPLARF
jgi:hypothetical protein